MVDNLDRLDPEPGRRLFISNGPLLKQLDAHVIYTVPIALALAPEQIGRIFESGFTIPTMNPKKKAAREALIDLISERIKIDDVFEKRSLVTALARASGGSRFRSCCG